MLQRWYVTAADFHDRLYIHLNSKDGSWMSHLDQHALVESCIGVSGCEHNSGIPSP
jgi:hypothetical protein